MKIIFWMLQIQTLNNHNILMSKCIYRAPYLFLVRLKGPKHEIFEHWVLTQIRPVRVGDLEAGKKMYAWGPG